MIEETILTKNIYSGKVIEVVTKEVKIDNKVATREIVLHRGAVCAVAVTKENKIILVRQFRKAIEAYLTEIPAGKLEDREDIEAAIIRELREETGYQVTDLKYVTKFFTSPGFSNELGHLFFAKLGEKGETDFDEDEYIDVHEYGLQDILKMINNGEITDAKTILGILMYAQDFS